MLGRHSPFKPLNDIPDTVGVKLQDLLSLRQSAKDFKLAIRQQSKSIISGASRSNMRGRGMEFAEVRPYRPGDDIRTIDWRVTARTQQTYTKLFEEEKERPVYILVDQRKAMFFGSQDQFKSVYAAKCAAFIAWCALNNNDRIGAMVFSDYAQRDIRAKRSKKALLAFFHDLQLFNHALASEDLAKELPLSEQENSLASMLEEVERISKPGSAIYVISDFHDYDKKCNKPLSMLARHNDVNLIRIFDELERSLPVTGTFKITNGENTLRFNSGNTKFNHKYTELFDTLHENIKNDANARNIRFVSSSTKVQFLDFVRLHFQSKTGKRGSF
ncbi:MAG: hypothetical protein ACI93R_002917 [Flavobacteriales bacterium]|jgi:uncharacterized protein (DUF58 family)